MSNSWLFNSGRLATISGFNYNFWMAAISSYSVSYVHQICFIFSFNRLILEALFCSSIVEQSYHVKAY